MTLGDSAVRPVEPDFRGNAKSGDGRTHTMRTKLPRAESAPMSGLANRKKMVIYEQSVPAQQIQHQLYAVIRQALILFL
jgi:hypothetical protein